MNMTIERRYALTAEEVTEAVWRYLRDEKGVAVPPEPTDILVMPDGPKGHPLVLHASFSVSENLV